MSISLTLSKADYALISDCRSLVTNWVLAEDYHPVPPTTRVMGIEEGCGPHLSSALIVRLYLSNQMVNPGRKDTGDRIKKLQQLLCRLRYMLTPEDRVKDNEIRIMVSQQRALADSTMGKYIYHHMRTTGSVNFLATRSDVYLVNAIYFAISNNTPLVVHMPSFLDRTLVWRKAVRAESAAMADETAPPAVKPKVGLRGKDKILPPNIVVEDCPNCGRQKLVGTVCMCQKFNEMGRRELRKMDLGE